MENIPESIKMSRSGKQYIEMQIVPVNIRLESSILTSSVTLQNIAVQDVKVEEFTEDPEFPSGGFDVGFD